MARCLRCGTEYPSNQLFFVCGACRSAEAIEKQTKVLQREAERQRAQAERESEQEREREMMEFDIEFSQRTGIPFTYSESNPKPELSPEKKAELARQEAKRREEARARFKEGLKRALPGWLSVLLGLLLWFLSPLTPYSSTLPELALFFFVGGLIWISASHSRSSSRH